MKSNAERYRAHHRNRLAKLRTAGGAHSKDDIAFLLTSQQCRCVYCKEKLHDKYHVDHIIAISKGGSNDRRNLQILCGMCNRRKHNKDPIEFAQKLGLLL